MEITWDSQQVDNQMVGSRLQGILWEGNLEPEVVVDSHRVAQMQVVVDIRQVEEFADLSGTSAEQGAPPSPVVVQTCHLFYPFRSCAVSACKHKPCNKLDQTNRTESEKPLEFRRFQQSLLQWKICMRLVGGRT
eukprot:TRINITY_DN14051_c3_g1_i1.p2 TRINITY_DN14051_c3_g1~~TRINITY_DN14051_c3_g1_i1.p2  ORF type:complete len:134 (+),score=19.20 TRINITY_DN14051_c3_g1_i1:406-807(+)